MSRFVMLTAVAKDALQDSINDRRVMKMRSVARLHAASGSWVTRKAIGRQIVLIDVEHPLMAGTAFVVPARIAHARRITTTVSVQNPGAAMPAMDHGSIDDMRLSGVRSRGRGGM